MLKAKKRNSGKNVRKNNGEGINLIISSCHGLRCHSASSIALAPSLGELPQPPLAHAI